MRFRKKITNQVRRIKNVQIQNVSVKCFNEIIVLIELQRSENLFLPP
jgi:hypothetical protein